MDLKLPYDISRYLYLHWTERDYFSYICIDRQGHLLKWDEEIQLFYGLDLNKQQLADEQLIYLSGFFPYEEPEICILEYVNFANGRTAHLHIVPTDDTVYVLFFDATNAAKLKQELQQTHNELKLLYQQEVRSRELLQKTYIQLEQHKKIAEKANQFKSKFLKNISHDLKNPLNSILGFAELLEFDPLLNEDQKDSVQMISNSSHYILQLITELLDAAKVETNNMTVKLEQTNIIDIIEKVIKLVQPMADKEQLSFFQRLHSEQINIWIDRLHFQKIIMNILSNAIKYNNPIGCIIISSYITQSNILRINIRDTGVGIATDQLDKVFEDFERGTASSSDIEGTGLGLGICKQLVELMQGRTNVYSDTGLGSLFWLELPLSEAYTDSKTNLSVLFIEQQNINIELMNSLLDECSHYQLQCVENTQEAFKVLDRNTTSAIILSANLTNYLEILHLLKAHHSSAELPVVVLFDCNVMPEQITKVLQAGAYDYLMTPFNVTFTNELFERLASVTD